MVLLWSLYEISFASCKFQATKKKKKNYLLLKIVLYIGSGLVVIAQQWASIKATKLTLAAETFALKLPVIAI